MIRTAVVVCAVVGLPLAFGVLRTQPTLEAAPRRAESVAVSPEPRVLPPAAAQPLAGEKPRVSAPIETDWSVVYAAVALDEQARRQVRTTSASEEASRSYTPLFRPATEPAASANPATEEATADEPVEHAPTPVEPTTADADTPAETPEPTVTGPAFPVLESGPRLTSRVLLRHPGGENATTFSLAQQEPAVQVADDVEPEQPAAQQAKRDAKKEDAAQENASEENTADADTPQADAAAEAKPPIRPEVLSLQQKVRQALAIYYPRQLNTRDNDVWEVMHSLIAFGVDTNVHVGGPGGQSANAIGWICFNGACKGQRLFYLSRDGKLQARQGHGVQGHHGQFLAMLAQSRVMADYPIKVSGRDFTIADLIEFEKATCQPKSELTFKLIALAHYLDLNETWQNEQGQEWSIPRLIQEEIAQPIRGAACGGTHRLFGLSYAVQRRMRRGEPLDGEYLRAAKYIRDYHRYTFSLQNRDGSLSTEWFTRPGNRNDVDRKVQTSGHILEWLVLSLPEEELQGEPMSRAIDFLASTLIAGQNRKWEIGPLGHAVHALTMYDQRITAMQKAREQSPEGLAQRAEAQHDTDTTDAEPISIEVEDADPQESARPAVLDVQGSLSDPLPRQARLPELNVPQTIIR